MPHPHTFIHFHNIFIKKYNNSIGCITLRLKIKFPNNSILRCSLFYLCKKTTTINYVFCSLILCLTVTHVYIFIIYIYIIKQNNSTGCITLSLKIKLSNIQSISKINMLNAKQHFWMLIGTQQIIYKMLCKQYINHTVISMLGCKCKYQTDCNPNTRFQFEVLGLTQQFSTYLIHIQHNIQIINMQCIKILAKCKDIIQIGIIYL